MKVSILLPNIFNHPFTYIDKSKKLKIGNFVKVEFGSNLVTGVVWDFFEEKKKFFKLKTISKKLEVPRLKKDMINFINWFSTYNVVPLGMALRLVLLNKEAIEKINNNSFDQFISSVVPKKFILNDDQKNVWNK